MKDANAINANAKKTNKKMLVKTKEAKSCKNCAKDNCCFLALRCIPERYKDYVSKKK